MSRLKVEIKGSKELAARLAKIAREFPGRVKKSLYFRTELIMTDSKKNYCPVKDGILRSSGHVVPDPDPKRLKATMGYGGPAGVGNVGETNSTAVGYAVLQHEREDYRHTVGEAGYLRKPVLAAMSHLASDIVSDVRVDK